MKFKFNPKTLRTTIRFKPDFRFKENKQGIINHALKGFYSLNNKLGVMTI